MLDPVGNTAARNYIPQSATLPVIRCGSCAVPRTLLHAGLVLAVILAVVVFIFLWRTTIGFRIRG